MNKSTRALLFALGCFVLLATYVVVARTHNYSARASAAQAPGVRPPLVGSLALVDVRRTPHVLYRSARTGEFSRIVIAGLDDVEGRRFVTPLSCERAHFDRLGGICLTYDRDALSPNFRALLVDTALLPYKTMSVAGYPSRTSLSRDGKYAGITVFTTGDSYDSDFSTRTLLIERRLGDALPDLEQFTVLKDARPFKRVDFNFWGITFAPDNHTFYATLSTQGTTYLVKGDVTTKALVVIRENVECPSLSPGGRLIAFKRRDPETNVTRLHTLDIDTWLELPIRGESRNIDDQVAWLDDTSVLYGVTTSGAPEQALNVWVASIASDGVLPRVFITGASSPSVVR